MPSSHCPFQSEKQTCPLALRYSAAASQKSPTSNTGMIGFRSRVIDQAKRCSFYSICFYSGLILLGKYIILPLLTPTEHSSKDIPHPFIYFSSFMRISWTQRQLNMEVKKTKTKTNMSTMVYGQKDKDSRLRLFHSLAVNLEHITQPLQDDVSSPVRWGFSCYCLIELLERWNELMNSALYLTHRK